MPINTLTLQYNDSRVFPPLEISATICFNAPSMECKCENLLSVLDKGSVDLKVLAMQINQIQISHLQLQKKESGINHEISITTKRKGEVLLSDGSLRLKLDK